MIMRRVPVYYAVRHRSAIQRADTPTVTAGNIAGDYAMGDRERTDAIDPNTRTAGIADNHTIIDNDIIGSFVAGDARTKCGSVADHRTVLDHQCSAAPSDYTSAGIVGDVVE